MLGRSAPLILVAGQQILDGVVSVEGIDRADLIGKLLPTLGTLALTVGPRPLGLLSGEAVLFQPAVNLLTDGAVGVEAKGGCADDAVLVEYRGEIRVTLAERHVGQIDRLSTACQRAVWVYAIGVQQIKEGGLGKLIVSA